MTSTPSRSQQALLIALTALVGAFVAVQSRLNGGLAVALSDGFMAALFSFGSGLVILTIGMLIWRPGRTGLRDVTDAIRSRSMPGWFIVGGLGGGLLVLSQSLAVGVIGVALFTVAVVAGQTLSGLLIDRRGLGSMGAKPITVTRVVGTVVALVAVVLSVSTQVRTDIPIWLLILPLIAGCAIAWQQAMNGQVRQVASSALTATWLNFIFGTALLALIAGIHGLAVGVPTSWPTEPWLYIGGAIGVAFIAAQSVIVRHLGALLMGLALVAGQLVMSAALDLIWPTEGRTVAVTTLIGTAITIVAVVIAALPSRRLRAPRGASSP